MIKVAAGRTPKKVPLPLEPEALAAAARKAPVPSSLAMPGEGGKLHPVAAELLLVLGAKSSGSDKRVAVTATTLPKVTVTKVLAKQAARAWM